jgi:hypothetical protein
MMLKLLSFTALALGLSSGVALADRDHRGGDHRPVYTEHRSAPQVVRDHREYRGGAVIHNGGNGGFNRTTVVREGRPYYRDHGGSRVVIRGERFHPYYHNVVRRPIYVSRPIIRARYYDYYRRPSIIVENYGPRAGYYWVAGQWSWNGYEWLWQPGHYEPDPNYVDQAYDSGYYDSY